ncbi:MAG: polyamine aminopropyltransferase [Bacteroidia bacterium]|jgi:spermidine synthase|nr:polyamine aminopropyltransferase [Bacteroidia bacterium]
MQLLLLIAVFVVATCGLVYELVAGTLASYLLGDSVTQFSTIIGVYLFAMGIGSWLSRYFERNLLSWFIQIEILVGVVGGFSSALLFYLFPHVESFRLLLYLLVGITGTLVGLEIPLLLRILKDRVAFRDLVSKVFTFDYIGALLASVIFPLLLVPYLGLIRTSMLFGIMNAGVGLYLVYAFREELSTRKYLAIAGVASLIALLVGMVYADRIMEQTEETTYHAHVVYSGSTPYQRMVLTKNENELRLFLNGNLQFSSADEYRYHEALVHPGMVQVNKAQRVLVLGGGDGLAVREILKYPFVKQVVLVDLDPQMTTLFSQHELLTTLNSRALLSPKVRVQNADAFRWLTANTQLFDFIVVDFPDPSNYSIGKLYTKSFYDMLGKTLAPGGAAVIQSTSPFYAPQSFWCIHRTIQSAGLSVRPYHALVPSFGEWGFMLVQHSEKELYTAGFPAGLRFIDESVLPQLFHFPKDMAQREAEVNRLNNQALVHYFEKEWSRVN